VRASYFAKCAEFRPTIKPPMCLSCLPLRFGEAAWLARYGHYTHILRSLSTAGRRFVGLASAGPRQGIPVRRVLQNQERCPTRQPLQPDLPRAPNRGVRSISDLIQIALTSRVHELKRSRVFWAMPPSPRMLELGLWHVLGRETVGRYMVRAALKEAVVLNW